MLGGLTGIGVLPQAKPPVVRDGITGRVPIGLSAMGHCRQKTDDVKSTPPSAAGGAIGARGRGGDAAGVMALAGFGNRQGTGNHGLRAGRSSRSSFLLQPSSLILHPFPNALRRQGFMLYHRFPFNVPLRFAASSLTEPLKQLASPTIPGAGTCLPSVSKGLQETAIHRVPQCREAGAGRYAREARKRLGIRRLVQNQLCYA